MKSYLRKLKLQIQNMIHKALPSQSDEALAREASTFWADSSEAGKRRDHSHWRGEGQWEESKWTQMGEKNFSRFQWLCSLGETPQKDVVSMVEWGSGGGANILRFSTEISTIYGVDISSPNLEECQRQVEAANFKGFHPVNISAETPEGCLEKIPHSLDFFLSTAVFQHFPGKQYGVKILKIAAELLRPEGLALIQIRYDNSNPKFAAKKRNYLGNAMTFTSYSIDEFWDVCKQSGFSPMAVQLNTDLNYAYYFLKKI